MIPACVAVASALLLLLHLIALSKPVKKLWSRFLPPKSEEEQSTFPEETIIVDGFFSEAKAFIFQHGGLPIFAYKFARFIGCLAFLGLSLATFVLEEREEHTIGANKKSGGKHRTTRPSDGYNPFSRAEWLQFAMCMTAVSSLWLPVFNIHSLQPGLCLYSRAYFSHCETAMEQPGVQPPGYSSISSLCSFCIPGSVASYYLQSTAQRP